MVVIGRIPYPFNKFLSSKVVTVVFLLLVKDNTPKYAALVY